MTSSAAVWPPGVSSIDELVRETDWSATSLGPLTEWPASLRVAVSTVLDSPAPMIVLWGPQLVQIYNHAYRLILGLRHPAAMGQPTQLCWPEVWHFNAPIYHRVMAGGECFHFPDQEFVITPSGQSEVHYFTISYLPARDESGRVCGVNVIAMETTARVLAERDNVLLLTSAQTASTQLQVLNEALATRIWRLEKAEKRQALQLAIADLLRSSNHAETILSAASALLGRYLNAARVLFASVDGERWSFHSNYTDGTLAALNGTVAAAGLGFEPGVTARAVREVGPALDAVLGPGVRSNVLLPFYRGAVVSAVLLVNHSAARLWSEEEVALIEDLGERLWSAVERIHAEQQQQWAEAKLRDSEMLFSLLLESSGEGICGIGADRKCTFINSAGALMLGYVPAELLGQDIRALVLPLEPGAGENFLPEVVAPCAADALILKKDGSRVPVTYLMRPLLVDGHAAGAVITYSDSTERKRAEQASQQAKIRLHQLLAHQEQIKEEERKRVAREIHDNLGQNLLALRIDISILHARTARSHGRLHERVSVALHNIDATLKSVRVIINDLRPFELELGLQAAVEWQMKRFERISGIACRLTIADTSFSYALGDERTLAVFRILQEGLNNILRHSMADRAEVSLSRDEAVFCMTIGDNGVGIFPDDKRKAKTFGLVGMRERLNALGGQLLIESPDGLGTLLSIALPLERFKGQPGLLS